MSSTSSRILRPEELASATRVWWQEAAIAELTAPGGGPLPESPATATDNTIPHGARTRGLRPKPRRVEHFYICLESTPSPRPPKQLFSLRTARFQGFQFGNAVVKPDIV